MLKLLSHQPMLSILQYNDTTLFQKECIAGKKDQAVHLPQAWIQVFLNAGLIVASLAVSLSPIAIFYFVSLTNAQ